MRYENMLVANVEMLKNGHKQRDVKIFEKNREQNERKKTVFFITPLSFFRFPFACMWRCVDKFCFFFLDSFQPNKWF